MVQVLDSRKRLAILVLLLTLLSLILYRLTLAPTYSWGDSADFAIRLAIGDRGWEGTPRDYDMFDFVLRIFRNINVGNVEARANFVTSIFGAASVGLTAYLAGLISKSTSVALVAGSILMVSHTFWLMSVIAEVYTFNTILVLLVYINIFKYKENAKRPNVFFVGMFTGLCLSHHSTGLIVLISQISFIYKMVRQRKYSDFAVWFASILLFGVLYVQRVFEGLNNQQGFFKAFGVYRSTNFLNETNNFIELLKFIGFLIYNFPAAFALLLLFLVQKLRSSDFRKWRFSKPKHMSVSEFSMFSTIVVCGGIWSTIPDKHNIFVLSYPFFSVVIARKVVEYTRKLIASNIGFSLILILVVLSSPTIYFITYNLANQFDVNLSGARLLNERDNNRYFLWPPKNGDYGPEILANKILADLPTHSIIIADYTIFMPLTYELEVQNKRSDLSLVFSESLLDSGINEFYNKNSNQRVFLASNTPPSYYGIQGLNPSLSLSQKGVIFEIIKK